MKRFLSCCLLAGLLLTASAAADSSSTGLSIELPSLSFGDLSYNPDTSALNSLTIAPVELELPDLSYNAPDVSGLVAPEVQAMYNDMLPYLGEVAMADLSGLTDIQAADLAQLQYEVSQALASAFRLAGIDLTYDPHLGVIVLDSSVLYASDAYVLTAAGRESVRSVMQVLVDVLSRPEYRDSVAQILIAGHTDTDGSYDYNVDLSNRRAEGVRDFCLSDECGLAETAWLSGLLNAKGYSYDHLIRNADGSENKDASRRVEIRFAMTCR